MQRGDLGLGASRGKQPGPVWSITPAIRYMSHMGVRSLRGDVATDGKQTDCSNQYGKTDLGNCHDQPPT